MNMHEAIELFIKAKRFDELSNETIKNYNNALAALSAFVGKERDVNDVSPMDLMNWKMDNAPRYKLSTLKQYLNIYATFFNFFNEMELIDKSPMNRNIRVSRQQERKAYKEYDHILSLDEVKIIYNGQRPAQMHKNAFKRNRAMLALLLMTGVRASTLCDIRMGDLDNEQNRLYVRTSKGGKQGYVAYPEVAQKAVDDYLNYMHENGARSTETDYLFTDTRGMPYNRNSLAEAVMSAIRGYTGKEYRPHSCRHWFARTLVTNGMSESEVGKLLMHSSTDTAAVTYVYTGEDNTQQIAKCNDVFNMLFS